LSWPVRSPKDLWAGLLYIAVGGGAILLAQSYGIGTPMRMGSGLMPSLLGACLVMIGLVAVMRSFVRASDTVIPMSWRPLIFVVASLAAFAALLPGAGLLVSLAALLVLAAAASGFVKYSPLCIVAALLLIAFCVAVFVKGLGIPLPLIGRWFTS
jgi:hypothetical protein